ncbi:2750_t:CDS:2 [Funneliformis caledonium]|uniref:2750_t:CDS:1 n=1 Tax=Funneliformis caledonium TaxID=1117310 RepID=A0A9N9A4Z2_9GLOM|nr:2750_t:CDS:2 [Funneliformis caledonium]
MWDIKFINHHLQLDKSSYQVDTSSTNSKDIIACELKLLISENAQIVYLMQEAHHMDDYNKERRKEASVDDYFIFIITKDCSSIKILNNSGIVDKNNWNDYFGFFSVRAYMYAEDVLDLNPASRVQLQIIDQIGERKANMILEERNKRKFKDLSDAEKRLPSIKKQLTHFKVSSLVM